MRLLFPDWKFLLSYHSLSFACFFSCFFTRSSLCLLSLSAVCLGSIFLLYGFLIPLGFHSVSFSLAPPYFSLAISCLFRYFLPWWSSLRCFGACLALVLSPLFAWAVLSFSNSVGFIGSPSLSSLSHCFRGSPSSFCPYCSSLHFSFERSSDSVKSPVPSAMGSSLWAEFVPY